MKNTIVADAISQTASAFFEYMLAGFMVVLGIVPVLLGMALAILMLAGVGYGLRWLFS